MQSFLIECILLGLALSIDATVVSFSQGLVFTKNKRKNSTLLAFFVALFQFLFPIIGWWLATFIEGFVSGFANWIAAAIFTALGTKFILDAINKKNEEEEQCTLATPYLSLKFLLLVSVATSIDALGAGISLKFLNAPILLPALIIGVITFINSLIGFWSGYCFKSFDTTKLEISAGIILVLLGIKSVFS